MCNCTIKPLEWEETDERWWGANPIYGLVYEIRVTDRGTTRVRLPENGGWDEFSGELEAAKAAAQADFEQRIKSAIASVPAPSGAEAVGWQWKTLDTWHTIDKSSVADPEAYARAQASGGQYRPIYAAPQAVPAEDVGPIEDALHSCVCLLETLAESAKERDDHTEWAMMSVMAENCRATLTASEAEATSLRRKLKKAERIGKMMANAIYNVHQRGLHVNADDMDSLKECQEAWDRALTTDGGANG